MSVCLHPRICYSANKSQLSVSCHIVFCCLSDLTVFSHVISQMARFLGKKVTKHNMCVLIFSTTLSQTFLFPPPWRYTTHSGCVFYSPLIGL